MEEEALMRTLHYVKTGANWFAFYLDQGVLALANGGARFTSVGAVLAGAGKHDFESLRTASQKDPRASRLS
jgi:hypothetical protein